MKTLLMTGASGLIGKRLLQRLAPDYERIYLCVRSGSIGKVKTLVAHFPNVQILEGDLSEFGIFKNPRDRELVRQNVDTIIHAAALYDFAQGYRECYLMNVLATQNLLDLAQEIRNLEFFHYVSTIAVSGAREGVFDEDDLSESDFKNYNNPYALTKMQAEYLVRKHPLAENVKVRIYRPGIVIGDSVRGEIDKIDGPYYFLRLINPKKNLSKIFPYLPFIPVPFDTRAHLPLIPVDILVNWMEAMIKNPRLDHRYRSYHLCAEKNLSVKFYLENFFKVFHIEGQLIALRKSILWSKLAQVFGIPGLVLEYMYHSCVYSADNRHEDFPELSEYRFEHYSESIFKGMKRMLEKGEV